jgi:multicomponent K+:H+ antiporter subunit D
VVGGLIAAVAALGLLAGPVMDDMTATAEQLLAPQRYIATVLQPHAPPAPVGD